MRLDWTRTLRAVAIAAWGAFFIYLWVSGRATTYIGPKTWWVVALGAITLPLVALAYLWGARGHKRSPSIRELGTNGLLVAPILFTLMVPAPSLGALAVENKRTKNVAAPLEAAIEGDIRLYRDRVGGGVEGVRGLQRARRRARRSTSSRSSRTALDKTKELEVSRFMVGCCAADANAFSVKVTGAPDLPIDTWVQVKGTLIGTPGKDLKVSATAVEKVAQPDNPYS